MLIPRALPASTLYPKPSVPRRARILGAETFVSLKSRIESNEEDETTVKRLILGTEGAPLGMRTNGLRCADLPAATSAVVPHPHDRIRERQRASLSPEASPPESETTQWASQIAPHMFLALTKNCSVQRYFVERHFDRISSRNFLRRSPRRGAGSYRGTSLTRNRPPLRISTGR